MNAALARFDLAEWTEALPGLVAAFVIAAAANFLADHYGAPVMLFALLLGLAMNFLSDTPRCAPGISLASRPLLRIGIALLGCRITLAQMISLGWPPVLLVVGTMAITILGSMLVARWMGFNSLFGLLSGGATAICGASAALALSAALPNHPLKERATLFTVIGVSSLSTLAMILYPTITRWAGLDDVQAGTFIGASVHDVAQVVGAGYAISPKAGDTATIVKLLRVAMLLPVILATGIFIRVRPAGEGEMAEDAAAERPPLLPWFVVGFLAMVAVNSIGLLPAPLASAGQDASRWALVTAIAAIGAKTKIRDLMTVGLKPVVLMVMETMFLAALTLAVIAGGWL